RHPERSRSSGGAKDLPLTGAARKPNCTTTEIQNRRESKTENSNLRKIKMPKNGLASERHPNPAPEGEWMRRQLRHA
ncbi:MAG: hypothetical protein WAN65_27855, partial [Candidatus Sulfotelmatobacter sp.]